MARPRTGSAYEKDGVIMIAVSLNPEADGKPRRWIARCPSRNDGVAVDLIHAKAVAADLQRRYDAGLWNPLAQAATTPSAAKPKAPQTVVEYTRAWIKTQRYTTVLDDSRRIEFYLPRAALGAMPLGEVRPKHVAAFVRWLQDEPSSLGGTLAARTIRNIYSVVRRAFEAAVIEELVPVSPCRLPRGFAPTIIDKHPERRSTWHFTREEVTTLLSNERLPEYRRVIYGILLLTGCRIGEVAALRWRVWQKELKPLGKLLVHRSIERNTRAEKGTKTAVPREVPVHPVLAELLDGWQRKGFAARFGREPSADDLIVPSPRELTLNERTVHKTLQGDLAALSIAGRRIHDTRRTFISLARDDGARGEILRLVTHGPSRASMIDVYSSLAWETVCAEVAKLKIALPPSTPSPGSATGSATTRRLPPKTAVNSTLRKRRGRDSNPRYPFGAHRISSAAPSTTRPPLLVVHLANPQHCCGGFVAKRVSVCSGGERGIRTPGTFRYT